MKDMFLNCTYVNIISFSDHVVTFKFEGISILRLTGIFSGNFIIFWEFMWIDQNRSVLPVSTDSMWELIWLVSNRFLGSLDNISRCSWTPTELFETGKTDLFWSVHIKSQKIIKLPEKIPVKRRIEIPSNLNVTTWSEKEIMFT